MESIQRGNPIDDIKSAAGPIYVAAKKRLNLTAVGNDFLSFSRNVLAKLITPDTNTYKELRSSIFGTQPVVQELPQTIAAAAQDTEEKAKQ